jgi:hypothetical protein
MKKVVVDLCFGGERIIISRMELCLLIEFLVQRGPGDPTTATIASRLELQ